MKQLKKIKESKKEKEVVNESNNDMETSDSDFIRILLSHYAKYTSFSSEIYLKINDNKYTKIVNSNVENIPDTRQIKHFVEKGITYVYVRRECFNKMVRENFHSIEQKMLNSKKNVSSYETSGITFNVSYEGLSTIGFSETNINLINQVIDTTIYGLFRNKELKKEFIKHCEDAGYMVGHSILIIYIAGKICKETNLNFLTTMKRISEASLYHDYSLVDLDDQYFEIKLNNVTDQDTVRKLLEHPYQSAKFLPEGDDIYDETKKIILEHHELPNGDGYPKKLTASQISSHACLFIISEQITLCLLRNDFCNERLSNFLINSKDLYSQGNFTKFYNAALISFPLNY